MTPVRIRVPVSSRWTLAAPSKVDRNSWMEALLMHSVPVPRATSRGHSTTAKSGGQGGAGSRRSNAPDESLPLIQAESGAPSAADHGRRGEGVASWASSLDRGTARGAAGCPADTSSESAGSGAAGTASASSAAAMASSRDTGAGRGRVAAAAAALSSAAGAAAPLSVPFGGVRLLGGPPPRPDSVATTPMRPTVGSLARAGMVVGGGFAGGPGAKAAAAAASSSPLAARVAAGLPIGEGQPIVVPPPAPPRPASFLQFLFGEKPATPKRPAAPEPVEPEGPKYEVGLYSHDIESRRG